MSLVNSEHLIAAIESAWDEQCCGNRNALVCESCRAYEDAIAAVKYAVHHPPEPEQQT